MNDGQQQLRDQLHDGSQDDWRLQAGCRGAPVAMFYESHIPGTVVRVCSRCYVASQCLDAALAEESRDGDCHGYRGGLTSGERRRMILESGAVAA